MCSIKFNTVASLFFSLIPICHCFINSSLRIESYLTKAKIHDTAKQSLFGVKPIDGNEWPHKFPAKEHCSKCGLCETSFVTQVSDACAFLNEGMKRIDWMEPLVHGNERSDAHFGVMTQPIRLVKGTSPESQWTGVVTSIALSMLETKQVDAVVCIAAASDDDDFGAGQPIIAKTPEQVLRGRGVKPSLAPSLQVLDEIQNDDSIQRLLFCGVGCAVQAFRSVQHTLNVQEVYVLGTNCADNSPTPRAAKSFLQNGVGIESTQNVLGYEFMQDYKVHVKMKEGVYEKKPYFCLPGTIAKEAIAKSCLTCFDYTNGLADVVVGYMGAPLDDNNMDEAYQTLTIRNKVGEKMVQTALKQQRIIMGDIAPGKGNYQSTSVATVSSDSIILEMLDQEVPSSGMPVWIGNILATVLSNIGPKGLNFAKYSIDYHILRNYLYILNEWGEEEAKKRIPKHAMDTINQYSQDNSTFRKLQETILTKAYRA